MKRVLSLSLIFLLIFTAYGYAQSMLDNIRLLQQRRQAGEISEAEYNQLVNVLLKSGDGAGQSSNSVRSQPVRNGVDVQLNVLVTRYWRAKDLVRLTSDLKLTVQGRSYNAEVFKAEDDRMLMAFPLMLQPGNVHFKLAYRPNVSQYGRGGMVPKNFSFDFVEAIHGAGDITKVMDFIEVKNRNAAGASADAKLMSHEEYKSVLAQRRDREETSTNQLKSLFGGKSPSQKQGNPLGDLKNLFKRR